MTRTAEAPLQTSPERRTPLLDRPALRWAAFAVVFLWGLYQAVWNLAAATPNADEPQYVLVGRLYVAGDVAANHEQPPTAKYLFGAVQLLFGEGSLAPRVCVAVLTVLAGLIIFLWLRPELGWMPALIPAAFWLLLPRGVAGTYEFRLDRFAVLDPVMVFFAVAAMAAAWQWHRGRSVIWLAVAGVSLGLSVTSKPSTAVILPAFILLILARRRVKDILIAFLVSIAAFLVAVSVAYLAIGLRTGITDLIRFQTAQNSIGHLIDLAGTATAHPPWWANLYFAWHGFGALTAIVLAAGTIAAYFDREHRGLVVYLTATLAPLAIFYLFIARNALPSYYYAWAWALCCLAGIGVAWLLRRRRTAALTAILRTAGFGILGLALVAAASTSALVWNDGPTEFGRVDSTLRSVGIDHGKVLVSGVAPWEPNESLGDRATTDPTAHCIVAVATKVSPRSPIAPEVTAYLAAHSAELHHLMLNDLSFSYFSKAAAAQNCK